MIRSLHGRMLLVSAVATLLALAIAGVAIGGLLGRFVTEGLDRRLDAEVTLLASVVDGDGRVDRARLAERSRVLEAGPGWRWRIAAPGGMIGSADFPALAPPPAPPAPPATPDGAQPPPAAPPPPGPEAGAGLRPVEGVSEEGVALHARQLVMATRGGPVTITAAAPRAVVRSPIRGAVVPLLVLLAVLAAILTAAMLVQLRVGLRPLRRLRDEVAAIRTGAAARVGEDQPLELQPLAAELNALAADSEAALAAARGSAANLAHALKTPVATLAVELRDRPPLAAMVGQIDRTIAHHLARARAGTVNRRAATPLPAAVADVVAAVGKIHRSRALAFAVEVPGDLAVAIDAQDLDELLGNLIDNAARHARGRVAIGATARGRRIELTIADDGPGIPPAERPRAVEAGVRLDERGEGHGFGLAIVAELTSLYGGTLALGEAGLGGLLVTLTLPAARIEPA